MMKIENFYDTIGCIGVDSPDYGGMELNDFAHIAEIYTKYKDELNVIVISDHFMTDHRSWHYKVLQLRNAVEIANVHYKDPNTGIEGEVDAYIIEIDDVIHCRVIKTGFMFTITKDQILRYRIC